MDTTATNRKIRELLTAVQSGTLKINPVFQRRLVWKNKDKCSFIQTVLDGYPFPEIFVATGEIDLETGEGAELLVDGQASEYAKPIFPRLGIPPVRKQTA
jgi:uncharacterized protein with ParB-like and HNH nuclease domain